MRIKYLGHASFMITSDNGTRIITDPFAPGNELSYAGIKEEADIVTVSHGHADHNNVNAVRGNPEVVRASAQARGIDFKGVPSYHDEAGGKQRGSNMMLCFEVDGIRLCHLGDLGHRLGGGQIAELGRVDILFVPVGGYFTIDARVATEVCQQLEPRVIIPMHWNYKWGLSEIASVDEFLGGKTNVSRQDTSEVEFRLEELPPVTRILVLRPCL